MELSKVESAEEPNGGNTHCSPAGLAALQKKAPPETVAENIIPLNELGIELVHATRSWIQYGMVSFAVICIVIGAVEALFGK